MVNPHLLNYKVKQILSSFMGVGTAWEHVLYQSYQNLQERARSQDPSYLLWCSHPVQICEHNKNQSKNLLSRTQVLKLSVGNIRETA